MEDQQIVKSLLELIKPIPANSNQQQQAPNTNKIPITLEISVNVVVKNPSFNPLP